MLRLRQQRIFKCNQIRSAGDYFEARQTTRRPCGEPAHLVILHSFDAISVTELCTKWVGGRKKMGHYNSENSRPGSNPPRIYPLAVLVEQVVSPLLRLHPAPILFEMKIPLQLNVSSEKSRLEELLKTLVVESLIRMPNGGELSVTTFQTQKGTELEIADTGDRFTKPHIKLLASSEFPGCNLHYHPCPQGGLAVTLVLPIQCGEKKAA